MSKKVQTPSALAKLATATTLLALIVVVLGAYVRLSHAGLGCPDWPGCYGKLIAPTAEHEVSTANHHYPERPVESTKAWKEMIHRYFASTLGLLIISLAILCWRRAQKQSAAATKQLTQAIPQQLKLPIFLIALVLLQGALGMWTVTLLLKPAVVTLHLLAGMLTLALLWWVTLTQYHLDSPKPSLALSTSRKTSLWAALALLVVYGQIALGGWTSTNYVALHCGDFPTCQGQWWPAMDFTDGFRIWRGLGVDYEGGVLSVAAGTAVHVTHRLGALLVALIVGGLGFTLLGATATRRYGLALLALLGMQITLGMLNILLVLPIHIAVLHNLFAGLLLLSLITLNFKLYWTPKFTGANHG